MKELVSSAAHGRHRPARWMIACATAALGWMATAIPASADQNEGAEGDRGSRRKPPTLLATPPLYWNNLQRFVCSVTNVGKEPQEVKVTMHTEFRFIGGGPLPDLVETITLPPGPIRSFGFSVPRVVPYPTGNWCIFESADTSVLRASAAILDGDRVLSTIVAR